MKKYLGAFFIAAVLLVSAVYVTPVDAAGLSESQIQAIISLLMSFGTDASVIDNVDSALRGKPNAGLPSDSSGSACLHGKQITLTLFEGSRDASTNGQVTSLQRFLASDTSLYPEGLITGYFGPATERAVQRFQAKHSVVSSGTPETTGYGVVGSATRAIIAKICGSNTTVTSPVTTPVTPQLPTVSPAPPIQTGNPEISFIASPLKIKAGESSTLAWKTINVQRCILQYDSSEESVPVNGSKVVTPSQTTSYRLWCADDPGYGKDGPSAERNLTVTVLQPPTCAITANSDGQAKELLPHFYVLPGSDVTITWSSEGATSGVWASGDKAGTSGSATFVNLTEFENLYSIIFTGPGGSTTCTARVFVADKG